MQQENVLKSLKKLPNAKRLLWDIEGLQASDYVTWVDFDDDTENEMGGTWVYAFDLSNFDKTDKLCIGITDGHPRQKTDFSYSLEWYPFLGFVCGLQKDLTFTANNVYNNTVYCVIDRLNRCGFFAAVINGQHVYTNIYDIDSQNEWYQFHIFARCKNQNILQAVLLGGFNAQLTPGVIAPAGSILEPEYNFNGLVDGKVLSLVQEDDVYKTTNMWSRGIFKIEQLTQNGISIVDSNNNCIYTWNVDQQPQNGYRYQNGIQIPPTVYIRLQKNVITFYNVNNFPIDKIILGDGDIFYFASPDTFTLTTYFEPLQFWAANAIIDVNSLPKHLKQ